MNVRGNTNTRKVGRGACGLVRALNEQGENSRPTPKTLTEGDEIDVGTTVYATMQPVPGLPFPSESMGAEWMGSDSEMLEVTVKREEKESIVVVGVWVERCYESV